MPVTTGDFDRHRFPLWGVSAGVISLVLSRRWLSVALFFVVSFPAYSASLEYSVVGLDDALKKNTRAWLGKPPETPQARLNFLATVEERVQGSLQAMGFYRPGIDLELKRDEPTWSLLITVDPGTPVRLREVDVQLQGEASDDKDFQDAIISPELAPGEILNHGAYEDLKRRLQNLSLQRGYFEAQVVRGRVEVEAIEGSADLVLHFDSGPRYRFGFLRHNEEQLAPDLLDVLLTFNEGEYFDQRALQESQAMLQRTGYFSTVILRPQVAEAVDYSVPMKLQLYPASKHSFDVGVGYSTETEERLSVTWRTPRINAHGHSQETRLQYSPVNPSGRVTYSIPLSHPLKDILQLRVRVEDNEFGDLESTQKELGVRRERRADKWVQSISLRALNEAWDSNIQRQENDYLLPGFTLSRRNHRGAAVNPSSGFSQLYSAEAGDEQLGSDLDLVRLYAKFGGIASWGDGHRIVSRLELGAVILREEDRLNLAPSLSFFAGGSQSIRGFSYQSIGNELDVETATGEDQTLVVGGERLLVGSLEYQYSFTPKWRGAIFFDAGDAFNDGDFNENYGAGFGLHFVSQVGAMRLELANPISKDNPSWRLHFAIGAEF